MAFDREDALRKAEKLLRQGRLDAAIHEYLRVVEHQPGDLNTANVLGDLYIRAGQTDKAVAQYSRIAEHLAQLGFVPKAAALYKKIVKITPEDESALLRASELSATQGLSADARFYLSAAYQLRLRRGDRFGAAQLATRLAALDPSDLAGRINAARANAEWGDSAAAARQFKEVALELTQRGQASEAAQALAEAVRLDPSDSEARRLLVRGLLDRGDIDGARRFATAPEDLRTIASELLVQGREDEALQLLAQVLAADPEDIDARLRLARAHISRRDLAQAACVLEEVAARENPQVLLTLAEIELRARHVNEAGRVLRNLLAKDHEQSTQIVMLGCALGETHPDAGFECISAVVDMSVASGDLEFALSVLERFVARAKTSVPALLRLVEICVDGDFEHNLYRAQVQLADAYLAAEQWAEARTLCEDLVDRRPDEAANITRLMTALGHLGVPDAEGVVARRLQRRDLPGQDLFGEPLDFGPPGAAPPPGELQGSAPTGSELLEQAPASVEQLEPYPSAAGHFEQSTPTPGERQNQVQISDGPQQANPAIRQEHGPSYARMTSLEPALARVSPPEPTPVLVAPPEPVLERLASPEPVLAGVAPPEPDPAYVAPPEPALARVSPPELALERVAPPEPDPAYVAPPEPDPRIRCAAGAGPRIRCAAGARPRIRCAIGSVPGCFGTRADCRCADIGRTEHKPTDGAPERDTAGRGARTLGRGRDPSGRFPRI